MGEKIAGFLLIHKLGGVTLKQMGGGALKKKMKTDEKTFHSDKCSSQEKKNTQGISMVAKSWPNSPFYFRAKAFQNLSSAWHSKSWEKGQSLLKIGWDDMQVERRETTNEQLKKR